MEGARDFFAPTALNVPFEAAPARRSASMSSVPASKPKRAVRMKINLAKVTTEGVDRGAYPKAATRMRTTGKTVPLSDVLKALDDET